ncbi:MAG: polysaccharide biosynthesis C-terminal domain-containing protein [Bacilli bacterium]
MSKKSIGKNYFYNLLYQLIHLIVPLLVTPYVARVLNDDGIGKYSFSYSFASYFSLFASLGFSYYAQRELSKYQNDKNKQSIAFWEIIISRMISVVLSLITFSILVFTNVFNEDYKILLTILMILIISVSFDVTFYMQANEMFDKISIINIGVMMCGTASVFIFVKTRNDLWIYTLIQSLIIAIEYVMLWIFVPKNIHQVKISELHSLKHFLPSLILFLPTIAVSLYTTIDRTLIGLLVKGTVECIGENGEIFIKRIADIENGNYEYGERLVKMSMTIITSLGIVFVPRNSNLYSEGKIDELNKNIHLTCRIVFLLGFPLIFGIISVSDNLIPWYLGDEYTKTALLMKILSPLVLFIGLSTIFGSQYLVPTHQDKKFTISILTGTLINLIFNFILIPHYGSIGAAIATLIGEFIVMIMMYMFIRRNIKLKEVIINSYKYLLSSLIMFAGTCILALNLSPSIFNTFLIIVVGVLIYFICLIILRDSFVLKMLKLIKTKIRKGAK